MHIYACDTRYYMVMPDTFAFGTTLFYDKESQLLHLYEISIHREKIM